MRNAMTGETIMNGLGQYFFETMPGNALVTAVQRYIPRLDESRPICIDEWTIKDLVERTLERMSRTEATTKTNNVIDLRNATIGILLKVLRVTLQHKGILRNNIIPFICLDCRDFAVEFHRDHENMTGTCANQIHPPQGR